MAIRFTCPCGLTLEAEDQYAGQPTICPQCGKQKKIPSKAKPPVAKVAPPVAKLVPPVSPSPPTLLAGDPGFEVIEDDEPVVAAPKAKPRPSLTMRGDEDDRPVRKKKASAVVVEDRPAKPRSEDDDEPRPRKHKSKKKRTASQDTARMWKIVGGVSLLLLGIGLVTAWYFIEARRTGRLLVWGIIAAVAGLGSIGTGLFGNVSADSGSDDEDDDDYD